MVCPITYGDHKKGGGVALHVKSALQVVECDDGST